MYWGWHTLKSIPENAIGSPYKANLLESVEIRAKEAKRSHFFCHPSLVAGPVTTPVRTPRTLHPIARTLTEKTCTNSTIRLILK